MVGYETIERAVIGRLLENFPEDLSATRVKAGDSDSVIDAIFSEENANCGVYLEFGGGRPDRETFKDQHWKWTIAGVFLIRYHDVSDEKKVREIATKLARLFAVDARLGGVTPLARITDIDVAEPTRINDIPFFWLPFIVEALDR
jgi:hypothetical protein